MNKLFKLICIYIILQISLSGCFQERKVPVDQGIATVAAEQTSSGGQSEKKSSGITQREIEALLVKETKQRYKDFFDTSKEGPVIPGLLEDLVPQGLFLYKEKGWLVVSSNRTSKQASTLSIIEEDTGKLVKTVHLYNTDGSPYTGHASGVAISRDNVWISSGSTQFNWSGCMFYQIKLDDLIKSEDNSKIQFAKSYKTGTLSSFIQYSDGVLWVGDYSSPGGNLPDESHKMKNADNSEHRNWIAGYKLDSSTDGIPDNKVTDSWGAVVPDYILSIADNIQAVAFTGNNICLSQSPADSGLPGSILLEYKNVLGEKPHNELNIKDKNIPVWFLDNRNLVDKIMMPPMSEGIATKDNRLYILFESGSSKYRYTGTNPLDRIYIKTLQK